MIRLSTFLSEKFMNKIVFLYKQNPKGIKHRVILFIASVLSYIILEPLTYFRVIRKTQGGSYIRTLKILPNYFKEGFMRYLIQFRAKSKNDFSPPATAHKNG